MKRHPLLNLMWKAIIQIAWASGNKKNDIGTEIPVPILFYLKTSGYILYYYQFTVFIRLNSVGATPNCANRLHYPAPVLKQQYHRFFQANNTNKKLERGSTSICNKSLYITHMPYWWQWPQQKPRQQACQPPVQKTRTFKKKTKTFLKKTAAF